MIVSLAQDNDRVGNARFRRAVKARGHFPNKPR
jgi:hypothetical protein